MPTKTPTKYATKKPTERPTKTPTKAPIVACGSSSTAIVKYINSITLSNKTLSLSGNTSWDGALQYLIASNNKTGVQLSTCNPADQNRLRNRFAYLALIYSTGMQGQEATWFANPNECQWTGISCDANKIVWILSLSSKGLQGTIPDDVGLWTGLKYFYASSNRLGGSLPSSIGAWTRLIEFIVRGSQLGGSLPSSIGLWSRLTFFDVRENQLIGSVPSSIGAWAGVTIFDVNNNQLIGSLPSSIGAWARITDFRVYNNQLVGTVPNEVSKWTSIKSAYFHSNMFNGTMPVIGKDYCPKTAPPDPALQLWADCNTPEIVCGCCNVCK
jgi:hypothetical protein